MKAAVFAFTARGAETAETIAQGLRKNGSDTEVYLHGRDFESIMLIVEKAFTRFDALIFISACGIAVRAIAPNIKAKTIDAAVVVCDEFGHYAIPILSGHLGGANALGVEIATILGGEAVLTTATDINDAFSVDIWAKNNDLHIRNVPAIKEVSSRILKGKTIGFLSEYPYGEVLPDGVQEGDYECGIYVGADGGKAPFPITLSLVPRNLVLGIGCKRATPKEKIIEACRQAGVAMERVSKLCSIDIKAEEPGIQKFVEDERLETAFFSAERLMNLKGEFSSSSFVKVVTGTDNVCERAAVLGGGGDGKLIIRKKALDGVTVAVFEKNVNLRF